LSFHVSKGVIHINFSLSLLSSPSLSLSLAYFESFNYMKNLENDLIIVLRLVPNFSAT
jgi:hypothetical protein